MLVEALEVLVLRRGGTEERKNGFKWQPDPGSGPNNQRPCSFFLLK